MTKKNIPQVKLNLKPIMDERGLSVDELAFRCKSADMPVTRTTIYNLRDKPKGVHLRVLTALCHVLDVTPSELFIMEKNGT